MIRNIFKHIFLSLLLVFCWGAILISVAAYGFLTTTAGSKVVIHFLTQMYASSYNVEIGSYSGTIEKGLVLKNVSITGIPQIKGAVLNIQELHAQAPLMYWNGFTIKIINARLIFASSDAIVFNGTLADQKINGTCYANSVDAKEIVTAFGYEDLAQHIYGFITRVDFVVDGLLRSPHFKGHFLVDKFFYKSTQLLDGFGHLDLAILSLGKEPMLQGNITMESAVVKTHNITIDLGPSKVDFKGEAGNPLLDIHGSTRVDDISIDMAIKGLLQKPQLLFSSDPPMSEYEILSALMIKGWSGMNNEQSPQGVGLRRKLTDAFNVGMRFDPASAQVGQTRRQGYSRTIEGQMNVTDKFSLNVAQKYLPADEDPTSTANQYPERNNQTDFYLQYKKRF